MFTSCIEAQINSICCDCEVNFFFYKFYFYIIHLCIEKKETKEEIYTKNTYTTPAVLRGWL